jgi:hypothetical protein
VDVLFIGLVCGADLVRDLVGFFDRDVDEGTEREREDDAPDCDGCLDGFTAPFFGAALLDFFLDAELLPLLGDFCFCESAVLEVLDEPFDGERGTLVRDGGFFAFDLLFVFGDDFTAPFLSLKNPFIVSTNLDAALSVRFDCFTSRSSSFSTLRMFGNVALKNLPVLGLRRRPLFSICFSTARIRFSVSLRDFAASFAGVRRMLFPKAM